MKIIFLTGATDGIGFVAAQIMAPQDRTFISAVPLEAASIAGWLIAKT